MENSVLKLQQFVKERTARVDKLDEALILMQDAIRKHSNETTESEINYGNEDSLSKIVNKEVSKFSIDVYSKFADVDQSILTSLQMFDKQREDFSAFQGQVKHLTRDQGE